jgi:glycerate kinase
VAVTPVEKSDLETVVAFEQFPESKTAVNIAEWLKTSHMKAGLKLECIMCHATDGASNAVGSTMEIQAMTDATKADSIRHYTCYAHQVNRAAKYASGLEILYRTTMLNWAKS